jgi:glycerol-3-phosphate dehydrogenase (NAD(P)+)
LSRGIPTAIVAASDDIEAAAFIQESLMHSTLRIYTNSDVVGVELGGALKNIIALAGGICDGLGLGDNTKAALMTRGIAEISRLGLAMGGKLDTFMGLSGIGDLIVTCTSMHSRNRRFGILVGKGVPIASALQQIGMTVEGYHATKLAYRLSQKFNIEMPIVDQLYKILYENASIQKSIETLMKRPKIHESEVKI